VKNSNLKAFKVMSTVALTSLIFTSLTAFADNNNITQNESKDETIEQGTPFLVKNKFESDQEDSIYTAANKIEKAINYQPDEKVRLIVQVEQPSDTEQTTPKSK